MEKFSNPTELRPSPEFAPLIKDLKSVAQQIDGMGVDKLTELRSQLNKFLDSNESSELRGFALLLQTLE